MCSLQLMRPERHPGALILYGSASHNDDPRRHYLDHSGTVVPDYFSMYAMVGWITPWRSSAAVSSGEGEVMAARNPAMLWISAVIATQPPGY